MNGDRTLLNGDWTGLGHYNVQNIYIYSMVKQCHGLVWDDVAKSNVFTEYVDMKYCSCLQESIVS